jgi:hypothetical protein
VNQVEIDVEFALAAPAAREAVRKALAAWSERSQRGEIALEAVAHAGGAAEMARLAVPVVIESNAATAPPHEDLTLTIHARSAESAFPTFAGSIVVEGQDAALSRVRLEGAYHVPMGALGAAADAVAFEGVARDSLRRMFENLVADARKAVREEAEDTYRDSRRGGP